MGSNTRQCLVIIIRGIRTDVLSFKISIKSTVLQILLSTHSYNITDLSASGVYKFK